MGLMWTLWCASRAGYLSLSNDSVLWVWPLVNDPCVGRGGVGERWRYRRQLQAGDDSISGTLILAYINTVCAEAAHAQTQTHTGQV